MSEKVLSPDGDWTNAGTFDLRIVRSDPIGTFRVRPAVPAEQRQFKDRDGDTWTETEPETLRLTARVNGQRRFLGMEESVEDATRIHGPLTEIRPDVDVRAFLADVLEDMAEDVRQAYWLAADPVSERVYEKLGDVFSSKVQELREESA